MKVYQLISILLALSSTSAWAGLRVATYIVDETSFESQQFRADCASAELEARNRLPVAEKNLGLESNTLSLYAGISAMPIGPVNPNPGMPQTQIRYQCLLQFASNNKAVTFTLDSTKMKTHLSKEDWSTACQADQDERAARPGSVFTQYEMSATLFQGRICDVGYVEAVKKQ